MSLLMSLVTRILLNYLEKIKMYAPFLRIGAQIWNSIPYSIKQLKRSSFHKKINELLLNILRSEDDFVEVSHLINLFNTLG